MKVLRKSRAIEILRALSRGPKHVRRLQFEVGGSASTVEDCVEDLLKEGLIRERKLDSWPFRRDLELTEKGREITRITDFQKSLLNLAAYQASQARAEWILALLQSVGGKIEGRLRLQKLMFLLKHEHGVKVPYEFAPYIYGPYSADIFEDLGLLVEEGLLEVKGRERAEPYEIAGNLERSMSFELTEKGEEKAREILKKIPDNARKALSELNRFNKMSLGKLIRHVYDNYPRESLGI